jgi:hypothetical protein
MPELSITAVNPSADATDVYINSVVWVNFDADLNWSDTMSRYWISVVEDTTDYTAVVGTVSRSTNKERLIFTPTTNLKSRTKYRITVYAGTTGPSSGSGASLIYLAEPFNWDFTTGTQESGDVSSGDVQIDAAPAATGITTVSTYLAVSSTSPADKESNVDRATSSMYIRFNQIPAPPDDGWEDYVTITRKGVFG